MLPSLHLLPIDAPESFPEDEHEVYVSRFFHYRHSGSGPDSTYDIFLNYGRVVEYEWGYPEVVGTIKGPNNLAIFKIKTDMMVDAANPLPDDAVLKKKYKGLGLRNANERSWHYYEKDPESRAGKQQLTLTRWRQFVRKWGAEGELDVRDSWDSNIHPHPSDDFSKYATSTAWRFSLHPKQGRTEPAWSTRVKQGFELIPDYTAGWLDRHLDETRPLRMPRQ